MLIVHLFVTYARVNLFTVFSSFWCQGLAATSACGSSWTFLFIFIHNCALFWNIFNRVHVKSLNVLYEPCHEPVSIVVLHNNSLTSDPPAHRRIRVGIFLLFV